MAVARFQYQYQPSDRYVVLESSVRFVLGVEKWGAVAQFDIFVVIGRVIDIAESIVIDRGS